MRVPKSVALDKILRGQPLDEEEREAVDMWQERRQRGLGRKTGAMPKGPLKRLRAAGWVALDYAVLRAAGIQQEDAEHRMAERYQASLPRSLRQIKETLGARYDSRGLRSSR